MLENIGGRKFVLAMSILGVTTGLTWFSKIDQGAFTTVTLAVIGSYLAANVIQKRAAAQQTPA